MNTQLLLTCRFNTFLWVQIDGESIAYGSLELFDLFQFLPKGKEKVEEFKWVGFICVNFKCEKYV